MAIAFNGVLRLVIWEIDESVIGAAQSQIYDPSPVSIKNAARVSPFGQAEPDELGTCASAQ